MAVGGSSRGRGVLFVGAWFLSVSSAVFGCTTAPQGASNQREGTDIDAQQDCSVDEDCPTDMRCDPRSDEAASRRLQIVAPPMSCPYAACTETAECAEGLVCQGNAQARVAPGSGFDCPATVCATPCESDSNCVYGDVCRESGVCEVLRCDEANGPECPAEFECDPTSADASPNGCRRLQCDEPGSGVCVAGTACEPAADGVDALGCRRLRCDEPEALECEALVSAPGEGAWECDPSSSTDASGCVPVPCSESDACYSDRYICTPTSTAGRGVDTDMFGCVRRNCEEGLECYFGMSLPDADGQFTQEPTNIGYCDFDGPNANEDGCAQRHCTELEGSCSLYRACEPEHATADERGCRLLRCDEEGGQPCGAAICDPTHPLAQASGCRSTLCDDLPDFVCPEGTECNSRGVNADPTGCAPIGDEVIPDVPTPADTSDPAPPDMPSDGPAFPTDPEPVFVPEANGGQGSEDVGDDVDDGRPAPGAGGSTSDEADDSDDLGETDDPSGPNSNGPATNDADDAVAGVCVPRN